jgi:D-serine dehydratase
MLDEQLDQILDAPVDWRYKAIPPTAGPLTVRTIGEQGWRALEGDLFLPALLLKQRALEHNIAIMADFCRRHGVDLSPHGKTTMAPQLFKRQLDAGAWAITAATASQVRIYRAFGIGRIVLANELVEPAAIRWIVGELAADPSFDFYCLVDSPASVDALSSALERTSVQRPLTVLLELGIEGGRAGCRTEAEALRVADAVAGSARLELAGVEGFEGIIHAERDEDTLAAVDDFVGRLRHMAETLAGMGAFSGREEILVTVGGSAYFDRVVARLRELDLGAHVRIVLRSGCYVTHDSGFYDHVSPLAGRASGGPTLEAALEVWGVVLSRPEPDRVIAGMGKRDVAYDLELPIPLAVKDAGGLRDVRGTFQAFDLNDQHVYVRVPESDPVAVGDLLGCGISHPCTAFDKWRLIPVVDDDYRVVDAVQTFF